MKLLNPLNVGLRLSSKYKEIAFERLKLLTDDVETIANIDRQLALFHEEMLRDFEPRLSRLGGAARGHGTAGDGLFR